jgi:hypothetical protein
MMRSVLRADDRRGQAQRTKSNIHMGVRTFRASPMVPRANRQATASYFVESAAVQ